MLQGAATWRMQCRQSSNNHVQHCMMLPPGEFNDMSSQSHVPHYWVLPPGTFYHLSSHSHVPHCRLIIRDSRVACHSAWCWHLANSTTCHPRRIRHIAGCCHLAHSITCHPTSTCYIAGCLYVSHLPHCRWRHQANYVSWSQSHV